MENQDAAVARDAGKESMGMKKLFGYAEKYIAGSDWKDFAMLKFCLFAMGQPLSTRLLRYLLRAGGFCDNITEIGAAN